MKNDNEMITFAVVLAAIGAMVGLGKLLQSGEHLTVRLIVGRMITNSVLSLVAFSVLVWIPDVSLIALVGISAGLGSLGEGVLEAAVNRYFKKESG